MRALRVNAHGGPEVLRWEEVPDPVPAAGEVLVRVAAVAVTWGDLLQREGRYPGGPSPPFTTGHDLAGTVVATGPGVGRFRPGDRVLGVLALPGAMAELCAVPAAWLSPTPDRLDDTAAACVGSSFVTAEAALTLMAAVRPGETVLVNAAAGGLGSAAVQLARAHGAGRVIATCGDATKRAAVSALGADTVLGYGGLAAALLEATAGHGVDVAVESVGGDVLGETILAMAPFGRVACLGATSGASTPRLRLQTLFDRSISVGGLTVGLLLCSHPHLLEPAVASVLRMLAAGTVHPVLDTVIDAALAPEAHARLASRAAVGRVVVRLIPTGDIQ